MKSTKLIIKVREEQLESTLELMKDKDFVKGLIQKQKEYFPDQYKNIEKLSIEVQVVN